MFGWQYINLLSTCCVCIPLPTIAFLFIYFTFHFLRFCSCAIWSWYTLHCYLYSSHCPMCSWRLLWTNEKRLFDREQFNNNNNRFKVRLARKWLHCLAVKNHFRNSDSYAETNECHLLRSTFPRTRHCTFDRNRPFSQVILLRSTVYLYLYTFHIISRTSAPCAVSALIIFAIYYIVWFYYFKLNWIHRNHRTSSAQCMAHPHNS